MNDFLIQERESNPRSILTMDVFYRWTISEWVELLPLGLSVVLPGSVLPHFLPRNGLVGILITSSPVGVEVEPLVPVEGIPFI